MTLVKVTTLILILVMAGAVVSEELQLRRLRTEVFKKRREVHSLVRGIQLAPLTRGLDSSSSFDATTPPRDSLHLLFYMTSSCPYCRQALPAWTSLADSLRASGGPFRPIAVLIENDSVAAAWVDSIKPRFHVVHVRQGREASIYRAIFVPQFAIVGAEGRVLFASGNVSVDSLSNAMANVEGIWRAVLASDSNRVSSAR